MYRLYSHFLKRLCILAAAHEAQLYLPRAIALLSGNPGAQAAWSAGIAAVPSRLLLPWAAQMLSLLDCEEGQVLLPPLQVPFSVPDKDTNNHPIRSPASALIRRTFPGHASSKGEVEALRKCPAKPAAACLLKRT